MIDLIEHRLAAARKQRATLVAEQRALKQRSVEVQTILLGVNGAIAMLQSMLEDVGDGPTDGRAELYAQIEAGELDDGLEQLMVAAARDNDSEMARVLNARLQKIRSDALGGVQ